MTEYDAQEGGRELMHSARVFVRSFAPMFAVVLIGLFVLPWSPRPFFELSPIQQATSLSTLPAMLWSFKRYYRLTESDAKRNHEFGNNHNRRRGTGSETLLLATRRSRRFTRDVRRVVSGVPRMNEYELRTADYGLMGLCAAFSYGVILLGKYLRAENIIGSDAQVLGTVIGMLALSAVFVGTAAMVWGDYSGAGGGSE